ncbi:hypothetical protein AVEN_243291-1 [Araneus ventricosus]|uniref:Uncharacterized protein n=1 Tax=Araneus ventricosus TaxID=182803 RepID=A0A4Y2Q0E8_ARAVE|nr:hypothetical protein AVEN_243291-1 [Araneus ventricosus]
MGSVFCSFLIPAPYLQVVSGGESYCGWSPPVDWSFSSSFYVIQLRWWRSETRYQVEDRAVLQMSYKWLLIFTLMSFICSYAQHHVGGVLYSYTYRDQY